MKCFRCFSFALFALLGVFFGSFIINQNNSYAVSDYVYTIDSSNYTSGHAFCGSSSGRVCSDYSYFYITLNFSPTDLYSGTYILGRFSFINNSSYDLHLSPQFTPIYTIDSSVSYLGLTANPLQGYSYPSGFNVTFTLTDTFPGSGSSPSGSLEITENGTYDVSQYAEAVVNVPETDCPPGAGGNYHEDLVAINNSIMICAATCLVIYFFYCIYRMIIKNSGVK